MAAPDRHIRHMHFTASSEADVRSMLPRLEDALRCASLPDDGARLCVVRKLALGNIAHGMSSQQMSRLIEQRVAATGARWVAGGTPGAEHASFVDFPGALEARIQLALRLVRGDACTAWYWPLAVTEFRASAPAALNLRKIAYALADLPEARAALPAWTTALIEAGAGVQLAHALSEAEGDSLVAHAGIELLALKQGSDAASMRTDGQRITRHAHAAGMHDAEVSRVQEGHIARHAETSAALRGLPRWLLSVLGVSPAEHFRQAVSDISREAMNGFAPLVREGKPLAPHQPVTHSDTRTSSRDDGSNGNASAGPDNTAYRATDLSQASTRYSPTEESAYAATDESPLMAPSAQTEAAQTHGSLWLASSSAAGLFFLLPVLVRLGLVQWAEAAQHDAGEFAMRVLRAALRRLRVDADDPLWQVVRGPAGAGSANRSIAPASWADPLLRGPGGMTAESLAAALAVAGSADAQAAIWLTAARRWLRRAGGIGLASLLLRRGQVSSTATHIDLYFRVDDVDMRVRRIGLDIDPGWLPWLGKVVGFHYVRGLP